MPASAFIATQMQTPPALWLALAAFWPARKEPAVSAGT
jgi:hypothetical protein